MLSWALKSQGISLGSILIYKIEYKLYKYYFKIQSTEDYVDSGIPPSAQ